LLDRDYNLEDFGPKVLTDEQQSKITEISNFMTGKASSTFQKSPETSPTSNDFEFENTFTTNESDSTEEEEDDFFADI